MQGGAGRLGLRPCSPDAALMVAVTSGESGVAALGEGGWGGVGNTPGSSIITPHTLTLNHAKQG